MDISAHNLLQIWISPERVGETTGCLAFIGISRPYFAITNKTRVNFAPLNPSFICYCEIRSRNKG